jgi:hypothetical protein
METQKEYYYTYYSYEEWGIGYFGSRGCKCFPEEDINYFGSFKDKKFKPTQKIILKSDYATREEAYADEIILQEYYKVAENPHFANKSYQNSTKFYYITPTEEARERGHKIHQLGVGIHARTKEQMSHDGRKSGKIGGKIGGNKCKELGLGFFTLTEEEKIEACKKGGKASGSQIWECTITKHKSTPGPLTRYQKNRGIDPSNRRRIK